MQKSPEGRSLRPREGRPDRQRLILRLLHHRRLSPLPVHLPEAITKWGRWIKSLRGLKARGITRVLPEERKVPSRLDYVQMSILWFSANVTANNLAVGLRFLCRLGPAYMSIWDAQSGNRTMVRLPRCAPEHDCMGAMRTNQGKIDCHSLFHGLLAVEAHQGDDYHHHVGYGVISCILDSQILSAVSGAVCPSSLASPSLP